MTKFIPTYTFKAFYWARHIVGCYLRKIHRIKQYIWNHTLHCLTKHRTGYMQKGVFVASLIKISISKLPFRALYAL